eukprot:NODE_2640_length_1019_cov_49.404709_g2621_i0.p2 GENE.NODE_2640_length_1019_cov_49.404709_g2621_i0~~NODE_2640_length_1019_cov_49.404709_g2621_i0.p2  ORF type:complete len:115 (-),score=4.32 NODE_2640_length_1019_cov_49.404709_g2621_i0:18-362(-)
MRWTNVPRPMRPLTAVFFSLWVPRPPLRWYCGVLVDGVVRYTLLVLWLWYSSSCARLMVVVCVLLGLAVFFYRFWFWINAQRSALAPSVFVLLWVFVIVALSTVLKHSLCCNDV